MAQQQAQGCLALLNLDQDMARWNRNRRLVLQPVLVHHPLLCCLSLQLVLVRHLRRLGLRPVQVRHLLVNRRQELASLSCRILYSQLGSASVVVSVHLLVTLSQIRMQLKQVLPLAFAG